jgi:Skp family chaperone for outer membrane proteins
MKMKHRRLVSLWARCFKIKNQRLKCKIEERIEMKNSKQMCVVLVVALVVLGAYQHGKLNADSAVAPAKIGVVNVTKVLENCQKHKQWQEKMQQEQSGIKTQFDSMNKELEALQANLKLHTSGSESYLKLLGELSEKSALMEAKNKFYQEKVSVEMQQWTEGLYQELLKVAGDVAKDKGFDMIIADELLDVPAPSLRDFMLTIKTKKLLYYNSQYDITDAVLAAMDEVK